MDRTGEALLRAIGRSLWGGEELPGDTDWEAVLQEAEAQAVLGIAVDAAPVEARRAWQGRLSARTAHFVRILHYEQQLCQLLEAHGIPLVILKGTAAAVYYPDPSKRAMGDIDFLVPPEQFDRAKALLVENGYTVDDDPLALRHLHVYKDNISFELHHSFSTEGLFDVEAYVLGGLSAAQTGTVCNVSFPMLPELPNGLVLLGHMVQHLKNGLGLRQVIDWMMYVHGRLDDAFWETEFQQAARTAGLETAAIAMTRLCQLYLGLPDPIHWCQGGDGQLCAALMESLLSSGNFGRKRGMGMKVEAVTSGIRREGLFPYLQKAGERNWQACQTHRWLRPLAWLYQIGRYAKKGFQTKRGRKLAEDVRRGRQRVELLQRLGIGEG